jgi:N-acetylmuramic acid 6-phosphate etherase
MQNRGHLLTEQRNVSSAGLHAMTVAEAFAVMNAADQGVAHAVQAAGPDICLAVDAVVEALSSGGRLIYVGAGTSGRLGVIDAAECPPTFLTPPTMVQGIIAGGLDAMARSIEGAEDRLEDGASAIADREVSRRDVVFGIASGATTPFVHGAIAEARRRGARTVFFACVPVMQQGDEADISIRVLTGPEVITGSTRLKAGTATKMVLNMVTSLAMVQLGKVYDNLMVDLNRDACAKLQDRAVRIVEQATGLDHVAARALLDRGGTVKIAIVMHHRGVEGTEATRLLDAHDGRLAAIVLPAQ